MIKFLLNKINRTLISLRFSILSIFISFFVVTIFAIIFLRSTFSAKELDYTAVGLMQRMSDVVLLELINGLRPIESSLLFSAHLVESKVISQNQSELIPYTFYLVKGMPLVQSVYFGNEQGDFVYSKKEKDGTISTEIITRSTKKPTHMIYYHNLQGQIIKQIKFPPSNYNHRDRPWYLSAKQNKRATWTDIYAFKPDNRLGLTTSVPVVENKKFVGAFGADVGLGGLTRFVERATVTASGYAYIITLKGDLIAFPKKGIFEEVKSSNYELIDVNKISLPLAQQSLNLYKKTGQRELDLSYEGKRYLVTYQPIPNLITRGWLVGVVTPKNDFIYFLQWLNIITMMICFLILLIAILTVSHLVTYLIKPMNALIQETEKIKHFELDHKINIRSRIKEIIVLRDAIESMKKGLKHFQKYVPKVLVKQLIESGQEMNIGGVRKQLVVFFSDIQNFTSIAEHMDPNQLMIQVCDYLEALTRIIIDERGTIDKYIGDSIMAFWGAPLPEDKPSIHAAYAALRCQAKVKELNTEWEKHNHSPLITRIGIHMGDAIVGNLGSSERLNYTALGDTINLTSRLESVNKIYKTSILVSEPVYHLLKNKFVLRMVDRVAIIGRTQTIMLYELLTDDEKNLSFNINQYNDAFALGYAAYENHDFATAISYFQQCLTIYPDDSLAPIFIERCGLIQ